MDDDDEHGEDWRQTDVAALKRLLAERLRATREFQRFKAGLLGKGASPMTVAGPPLRSGDAATIEEMTGRIEFVSLVTPEFSAAGRRSAR